MLKYLSSIFSAESGASFSRYATAVTVITGCYCLAHTVLHNHALPDGGAVVGLGAWMTAPYAVNKATAIFNRPPDPASAPGVIPDVHASAGRLRSDRELVFKFALGFFALYWLVHQIGH